MLSEEQFDMNQWLSSNDPAKIHSEIGTPQIQVNLCSYPHVLRVCGGYSVSVIRQGVDDTLKGPIRD